VKTNVYDAGMRLIAGVLAIGCVLYWRRMDEENK
jgi:hypothetical protein